MVRATSIEEPIRLLQTRRFFDDLALQRVAWTPKQDCDDLRRHWLRGRENRCAETFTGAPVIVAQPCERRTR